MRRATRPTTVLVSFLPLLAVAALVGCGGGDGELSDIASLGTTAGDDDSDDATDATDATDGTDTTDSTDPSDDDSGSDGTDGRATGGGMVVMGRSANSDDPEVQDAQVRYSRCMREHGVDMPDPGADGEVRLEIDDPDVWEEAEEECRPILEEIVGTFEPPSEEEQARTREQALEFAKCMREQGIDMPDPQFNDDGGVMINVEGGDAGAPGALGPDDDDFQAAAEECGAGDGGMVFSSDSDSDSD